MLIKAADDKQRRLTLLEELQASPLLDKGQRDWLQEERMRCQRGQSGEREAAHYINHWKKDSDNHAVLHDLRFVVDGDTAQIDHLVIDRMLHFYLIETKCYSGDVQINDQGEWTVTYANGRRFGVPSPLEQSRRHERILEKLLSRLEITGRLNSLKPTFHHLVLLHPKATITRPDPKRFDTRDVIKADMIQRWHEQYIETLGVKETFGKLLNLHSSDTLRDWAEKLMRQHRPANPLELPEFMKPKVALETTAPSKPQTVPKPSPVVTDAVAASNPATEGHPLYRKLICATCQAKISYPEGKFCWGQEKKFGGLQFCREHQSARPDVS